MVLAGLVFYTTFTIYNEPNLIDDAYVHIYEAVSDMFTYVEDKIVAHHVKFFFKIKLFLLINKNCYNYYNYLIFLNLRMVLHYLWLITKINIEIYLMITIFKKTNIKIIINKIVHTLNNKNIF